jgi:hypothetical protein
VISSDLTFRLRENVQTRRFSPGRFPLSQGLDQSQGIDSSPEVSFVELFAQNRLVQLLKVSQRELFWQQLETDGCVLQFVAKAHDGVIQNVAMIERQLPRSVEASYKD